MAVNPSFWRGKRVLVTGHTGFKGSWLSLWLQELGAEVIGFALAPGTEPSLFELARVAEGMESVLGDVRDLEHLERTVRDHRPEVVIHMAAQSLVRYSYDHPVETYATNVMGTVHVLEAVRRIGGVRAVVCVTSDKCYENAETDRPYREDDPMGGFDPYSSSKGCDELVVAAYRRSFFPPSRLSQHGTAVASARAGNVIGGGDWSPDRLVVDVVDAFLEGRTARIRFPDAVRPWQHVADPLVGYMMLAERLWHDGAPFAEAWNFGPDTTGIATVGTLVERLADLWGEGARWTTDGEEHPHEAKLLMLDAAKARDRLAWKPKLALDDALAWTVEWYRSYSDGTDVRSLTRRQIAAHGERVAA